MFDDGIVAVSWWLLTSVDVTGVPFHTNTELLPKLPPFTVRTKSGPPAVALLGEIELIEGVEGQEQETRKSRQIANAHKIGDLFVVVAIRVLFWPTIR
jgi:hypothetical protein